MRKLLSLLVIVVAFPAFAAQWKVNEEKSALTFSGKQTQEIFHGSFKKFASEIDFDEKKPEDAHIRITVDMASVTVDGKDRAEALPTDEWLNVKKFPVAEFTSAQVRKTGDHEYEALGDLTLHGVSKTIALPFRLTTKNGVTEVDGSVELLRNDYRIGAGRWADDQWVAFPVNVQFHLTATPK